MRWIPLAVVFAVAGCPSEPQTKRPEATVQDSVPDEAFEDEEYEEEEAEAPPSSNPAMQYYEKGVRRPINKARAVEQKVLKRYQDGAEASGF